MALTAALVPGETAVEAQAESLAGQVPAIMGRGLFPDIVDEFQDSVEGGMEQAGTVVDGEVEGDGLLSGDLAERQAQPGASGSFGAIGERLFAQPSRLSEEEVYDKLVQGWELFTKMVADDEYNGLLHEKVCMHPLSVCQCACGEGGSSADGMGGGACVFV